MKMFQVIWWQSNTMEGDPFEAESLEEAQRNVLEGQGLKVEEVKDE